MCVNVCWDRGTPLLVVVRERGLCCAHDERRPKTILRRAVAPGSTTMDSQLDRCGVTKHPAPHSKARVCFVGGKVEKG